MTFNGMFLYFPFVVHSQHIMVSGNQFFDLFFTYAYSRVSVTIASGMYVFHYYQILPLGPCSFLVYLRALLFIVLHQHLLMVQVASSSKSSHSQAKSVHTAIKIGPPGKKTVAVSFAKAKKSKQQAIKKYNHTGRYFSLSAYTSDVEFEQMRA